MSDTTNPVNPPSMVQRSGAVLTDLLRAAVLCALYMATAKLGLRLGAVAGFAAPVWPPTGISLAALSLLGCRLWPGIALGAFLVNCSAGAPPLGAAGMAAGNTLEAVIGAFLLQRVVVFRSSIERLQDVVGLVVLAAGLSTFFSATIGVTSGWLAGAIPTASRGQAWWTWWVGDMMGDLVLAPLLFVWAEWPDTRLSRGRAVEAAALLCSAVAVSLLAFVDQYGTRVLNFPYLPFPILIWAALRFGPRGAATTTFAVSAIATWGTAHGLGPFAQGSVSHSLFSLQAFMSVTAVTILVLAADVTQRHHAEEALRKTHLEMERRVQERTAELSRANAVLVEEVTERQSAEQKLRASQGELREHLDSLKQVEESLRKSEARLAEAQQIAHLGSWEWDPGRNVVTWSAELFRIFGLRPDEFDGAYGSYVSLLHPEDRELAQETIQRSYRDGQPFEFDHRIVRPDGTVRWVHGQGAVILDEAGQPVRMLGTARDITERKQAAEALRRAHDELELRVEERTAELANANRRKDEFLAMLAHELRNPIGAISNAVQIFKRVSPDSPSYQRAQETIERQIHHQTRLLDDLLNVSRIAHGKISLQDRPLDLVELVRDTAEDHRSAIEAAGLNFATELPPGPIWVSGDPTRLAQILDNLLHNAAKFTDRGGDLSVSLTLATVEDRDKSEAPPATHHSPLASITVRDTGIGIHPELLPHIFETFTQADRSLDRSRGGLGLGLALVKGLVELHGGKVRGESEGVGLGATFTVLLPVDQDGAPEAREGKRPQALPQNLRRAAPSPPRASGRHSAQSQARRILVVEDNRDAAESLRELLELSGHHVEVAFSGPEGLAAARRLQPEIVLCDLGLPGMDGCAVAAQLRREPTCGHLVAVTGYGRDEDRQRSREAGFELHLTKPVDAAELESLLSRLSSGV